VPQQADARTGQQAELEQAAPERALAVHLEQAGEAAGREVTQGNHRFSR
jgi:hypothetical protein